MSDKPLMPKATAVWLIENTSLTFEQIADFCGIHPLEVKGIADEDVAKGIKGIDPIATAAILQMGPSTPDSTARMSFAFDDDSGGNLDPRLDFTLGFDANVVLSIGSYSGGFGCYWVKVEVTTP